MENQEADLEAQIPQISNCVTFNGKLTSEVFNVGGGYLAFNIIGQKDEEFPLILIPESENKEFKKDDLIVGVGELKKLQDTWTIECKKVCKL